MRRCRNRYSAATKALTSLAVVPSDTLVVRETPSASLVITKERVALFRTTSLG